MSKSPVSTAFRFTTAGSLEHNPTLVRQRASVALSVAPSGTTFITRREGAMLAHYMVMPGSGHGDPINAAKAVAARAEPVEAPDLSGVSALSVLSMPSAGVPGSNPQMNAEIAAVVDAASSALRDGEWVACSIRKPHQGEVVQHSKWLSQYSVHTHHSKEANAVMVSLWSGADSPAQAQSLLQQVAGALPGFDMPRVAKLVRTGGATALLGVGTLAAAGYAIAPQFVDAVLPYSQFGLPLAAVGCVGLVLAFKNMLPTRAKRVRARLAAGLVPAPGRRIVPAQGARVQRTDEQGNITQMARNASYPLHDESYLVGAVTPITLVAPHAGAQSGSGQTAHRSVPPELHAAVGPLMGMSAEAPVFLTDEGDWRGLLALGAAGGGKSVLLQGLWGYDAARKTGQIPRPRGRFNAMVAFDTKDGKSAAEYIEWGVAAGMPVLRSGADVQAWRQTVTDGTAVPPLVVMDVADATSELGINLFPANADPMNQARRAVNALRYTFGENSIGPESFATLSRVMVGAFAVTPAIATEAEVEVGRSAFHYAGLLLGTRGDDIGQRLAQAIRSAGERDGNAAALTAAEMLAPLYGPNVTPAKRGSLTQAPQNKMEQVMAAEAWWSRAVKLPWLELLENNASVVVNFGQVNGMLMDELQREQLASLMLYTWHEEVKLHCVGWQDEGRLVTVYADELKHIARTSHEVVNWARQDGRSFGVRLMVATQEPEQLTDSVRKTVMGLGTLVAFQQNEPSVIKAVLENIAVDGAGWTPSDLQQLPPYHAIVRTHSAGQVLTAFTIPVAFTRAMRGEEFVAIHGGSVRLPGMPSAPISAPAPGGDITFATWDGGRP